MTYAELIKELYRRSGLGKAEYAQAVNFSPPHISNVLNDKQPGSMKAVLACLAHAKIDIQDCLDLPEPQAETRDEKRLLRAFRHLSDERREIAVRAVLAMLDPQLHPRKEPK